MSNFPKFVEIREEGPREGFQIETKIYPIEQRAELINLLSETGLKRIQVGSFVSPKYVPQMADTAELFNLIKRKPGINYTGLWLNKRGFLQALEANNVDMDPRLLFYTSDEFSKKNNNCTAREMREAQKDWIKLYKANGYEAESAYVMTAFGCNFEGKILPERVLEEFQWIVDTCKETNSPLPNLIIADTMGWGNPETVKAMISAVQKIAPQGRIGMHLHDTRGTGIANVYAAMSMGVDLFETSIAGLGGCPFAGHGHTRAAGNVTTEDVVYLCQELGIETGIDLDKLIVAALKVEEIIGSPLMGRVMHSGGLEKYRV